MLCWVWWTLLRSLVSDKKVGRRRADVLIMQTRKECLRQVSGSDGNLKSGWGRERTMIPGWAAGSLYDADIWFHPMFWWQGGHSTRLEWRHGSRVSGPPTRRVLFGTVRWPSAEMRQAPGSDPVGTHAWRESARWRWQWVCCALFEAHAMHIAPTMRPRPLDNGRSEMVSLVSKQNNSNTKTISRGWDPLESRSVNSRGSKKESLREDLKVGLGRAFKLLELTQQGQLGGLQMQG